MPLLCRHVTTNTATTKLLPIFVRLLKDKEAEVRQQGALVLGDLGAEVKGTDTLLGPPLETLAGDLIQTVRVAVAKALVNLAKRFPKEAASKLVIPLLKQLAKDENYEVRAAVLQDVEKIAEYLDPAALLSVVPLLVELAKDGKWRVRSAVVDKVAVLAKYLGPKKFEKQLQQLLVSALSDHVYAIRDKAAIQVGLVVQLFGGKWAAEKLFPNIFSLYDKTANYVHRMTCLLLIQHVAPQCSSEIIEKHILTLVITASSDEVANVRIAAAKTLGTLIPRVDPKINSTSIQPVLKKLVSDSDSDVVYMATLAQQK